MKLTLTAQELELIITEDLANQGFDLSDKTVEFTFTEGAEIDINPAEKPKRKRKTKTKEVEPEPDVEVTEEVEDTTDPFAEADDEDDNSLFGA